MCSDLVSKGRWLWLWTMAVCGSTVSQHAICQGRGMERGIKYKEAQENLGNDRAFLSMHF